MHKEVVKILKNRRRHMNNIKIVHANETHKDFIIYSNKVINDVNDTDQTQGIELNIDKDYFCDKPKFQCLVAEVDNKPVRYDFIFIFLLGK